MGAITAFHGSALSLMVGGGVLGLGQAFSLTAMANLVVATVAAGDVGIATGINGVMRTVGMALGSAMSAGILASGSAGGLPTDHAYAVAFGVAACVTAGAIVCAVAIRRPAREMARASQAARAARARVMRRGDSGGARRERFPLTESRSRAKLN